MSEITLRDALSAAAKNGHVGQETVLSCIAKQPMYANELVDAYVGLMGDFDFVAAEVVGSHIVDNASVLTDDEHNKISQIMKEASEAYEAYKPADVIDAQTLIAPQYNGFDGYKEIEPSFIPKAA